MSDRADQSTLKSSQDRHRPAAEPSAPLPGLILVFTGGQPILRVLPLADGVVEIGREHAAFDLLRDPLISRRHARFTCEDQTFRLTDLGSSNGTLADGTAAIANRPRVVRAVARLGESLFIPALDVRPIQRLGVLVQRNRVLGPAMQLLMQAVSQHAAHSPSLHITGESGAGKEGTARAFHDAAPGGAGRFVAVNCAAIPDGVAERLLFGARRGAFSGADADAEGYVQAAEGGTLFLDEIAELSLEVQAKLLRVLDTREVLPVGASRPRSVSFRLCSATHKELREQVAAGRMRADLYFRIATPQVAVPPLRQRPEEISWLLHSALAGISPALKLHVSLVEACLLRPWPGNIRELISAAHSAAQTASAQGLERIDADHLGSNAGNPFAAAPDPAAPAPGISHCGPPPPAAVVADALRRSAGNVSAAARLLQAHRTQVYRWMKRYGIAGPADGKTSDPEGL